MAEDQVEDVEEARAGAYGEKPVRDLIAKYQEGLSPEGKAALEKIAGKEGEEAIKAFQREKSLEDPRVTALRELAALTVEPSPEATQLVHPEIKADAKALLIRIGQAEVDRIIADPTINFPTKAERIKSLGFQLSTGAEEAGHTGQQVNEIVGRFSKDVGKGLLDRHSTIELLRGFFAVTMMQGIAWRGLEALEQIAILDGRDPDDIISEHIPLLTELRNKYPDRVNYKLGARLGKLDEALLKRGRLWSPGAGTYIQMTGATAPAVAAA